jgi:hypothetical protein
MLGRVVRSGTTEVYDTGTGHASGTEKRPAGTGPAGRLPDVLVLADPWFRLEAHPELAFEEMHVALEVLRRHPMTVEIPGTEVDKRDRAPI